MAVLTNVPGILSAAAIAAGVWVFGAAVATAEPVRLAQGMQHGMTGMSGMAGQVAPQKVGDLVISAPWSRATPGGAKVAGGYLSIKNTGATADRLVGGTSAAAGKIEIHEMSMDKGVMKMRPLDTGLEIKPGETIELKPGAYHVMFMDLKAPFKQGETVKATLNFAKAGPVEVTFRVGAVGEGAGSHGVSH